jgi:hypothetical protein
MRRWTERVEVDADCWMWVGALDPKGYGRTGRTLAHRAVYEELVGPCPDGLVSDHLCRRPACVNPDHIEFVTIRENTRRGLKRHVCKRGHRRLPWNLTGKRTCRICENERLKMYKRRLVMLRGVTDA